MADRALIRRIAAQSLDLPLPLHTAQVTQLTDRIRFDRWEVLGDPRIAGNCGHSFRALVTVPRDGRSDQPNLDRNYCAGSALAVRIYPGPLNALILATAGQATPLTNLD